MIRNILSFLGTTKETLGLILFGVAMLGVFGLVFNNLLNAALVP